VPLNPTALRSMVGPWLTSSCTIRGVGAAPVFDPEVGYVDSTGATVYTGSCRVRPLGGGQVVFAGEGQTVQRMYEVWLPWDTVGIVVSQFVTIDESNDPDMAGRVLRIVDVQGGTDAVHRKLICEAIVDVADWEEASP
jgi:hypothetical protein